MVTSGKKGAEVRQKGNKIGEDKWDFWGAAHVLFLDLGAGHTGLRTW